MTSATADHTTPRVQQVLQVECPQCTFDSIAEPDNTTLHIAAEQGDKSAPFPEDLRSSGGTGTGRMIDKVLFALKNSFILAVRLDIQ